MFDFKMPPIPEVVATLEDPYAIHILARLDAVALKKVLANVTLLLDNIEGDSKKRARVNDDSGTDAAAVDDCNKSVELKESAKAGDYVLDFGKFKGQAIKDVDVSYLVWAIGLKRKGRNFQPVTTEACDWIRENKPVASQQIKTYLMWRCHACRSSNVKYRFSRLCRDCWFSSSES